MAPFLRFAIAAGVLALAAFGGYFSGDPNAKVFLFGAAIMLLLPLTFVLLIDVVRRSGPAESNRRSAVRTAFSAPLLLLALCSAGIGAYLLIPLLVGPEQITWPNMLSGVLLALVLIGFSIRLILVVWRR